MNAYETAKEQLDKRHSELENARESLALCEKIRDEHYPNGEVEWQFSRFDSEIQFKVYVDDLKDAVPAMRALRAAGHKLRRHFDSPQTRMRGYCFDGGIRLDANLVGSACRFEVVGTEEKPVYNIVCGDGSPADLTEELAEVA